MTSADVLFHVLSNRDPHVTERLLAHSACNRFGDLEALAAVIELIDGLERQTEAMNALAAEIRSAGPDRDDRLRSPVFRWWLGSFGRIRDWKDASDPVFLRQLDMVDNMRVSFSSKHDWTGLLAVEDGVVMTWDCRIAVAGVSGDLVGTRKAGDRVTLIEDTGESLRINLGDPADGRVLQGPVLPQSNIAVRNDLPWLRLKLREGAIPTREDGVVLDSFDLSAPYHLPFDPSAIQQAGDMLRMAWPDEYEDFKQNLRIIVPRTAPPGWTVNGFTLASHQGAFWMGVMDLIGLIEHMVHEHGHIKLRYIEESMPILAPEQTKERFAVGWRQDKRPIVGIMEGVYVHLHASEALLRVTERGLLDGAEEDKALARAYHLLESVSEALPILKKHARWTNAGAGFLQWAHEKTGSLFFAPALKSDSRAGRRMAL